MQKNNRQSPRYFLRLAFAVLILLALIFGILSVDNLQMFPATNGATPAEKVAYLITTSDGKNSLMLFDAQSGMNIPILADVDFILYGDRIRNPFSYSADGRLAYLSGPKDNAQLYILDTLSAGSVPVNISPDPKGNYYPLAWSPDGHYLAFVSHPEGNNVLLYIWDGSAAINITPTKVHSVGVGYDGSWSFDGRLAFTVYDAIGNNLVDPSEIYLWDGKTTADLSQNPTASNNSPVWSPDGKLAFYSQSDYHGGYIYVWDGVTFKSGLPNAETFTKVFPEYSSNYWWITWTNKSLLAFTGGPLDGPGDWFTHVYVWDGHIKIDMSHFPTDNTGYSQWIANGQWTFSTWNYPLQQLVFVRDADNKNLFTAKGQSPALNSSGHLLFCSGGEGTPKSVIYMWDGQKIIEIASGYEVRAQWQGGASTFCTSFSG